MVLVVLGVAVFALALAVVGLFAMMGELAARVSDPGQVAPDFAPQPIEEARLGAAPADWPAELATVRDAERAHLLVFSSICATCARIASGATGPLDGLQPPVAVVISCPAPEVGADFLAKHPLLGDYPQFVDVDGAWVADNFHVGITPSVLVFESGTLRSAHIFTDATALSNLPGPDTEDAHVHPAKANTLQAKAAGAR